MTNYKGLLDEIEEALEFYRTSAGFPDNGKVAKQSLTKIKAFREAVPEGLSEVVIRFDDTKFVSECVKAAKLLNDFVGDKDDTADQLP